MKNSPRSESRSHRESSEHRDDVLGREVAHVHAADVQFRDGGELDAPVLHPLRQRPPPTYYSLQRESESQRVVDDAGRVGADLPQAPQHQPTVQGDELIEPNKRTDLQARSRELRIARLKRACGSRIGPCRTAGDEGENEVITGNAADDESRSHARGREIGERKGDQDNVATGQRTRRRHTGSPSVTA